MSSFEKGGIESVWEKIASDTGYKSKKEKVDAKRRAKQGKFPNKDSSTKQKGSRCAKNNPRTRYF